MFGSSRIADAEISLKRENGQNLGDQGFQKRADFRRYCLLLSRVGLSFIKNSVLPHKIQECEDIVLQKQKVNLYFQ